jgi:hypothetical protein
VALPLPVGGALCGVGPRPLDFHIHPQFFETYSPEVSFFFKTYSPEVKFRLEHEISRLFHTSDTQKCSSIPTRRRDFSGLVLECASLAWNNTQQTANGQPGHHTRNSHNATLFNVNESSVKSNMAT